MAKRSSARAAWLAAAAALAVTAGLAVAAPGMSATADRARTKDLAVRRSTAAGVAWTRHGNLDWGVAEPTMGRVDWRRIDGIAQDLRVAGA
jgi:hypothetical protein